MGIRSEAKEPDRNHLVTRLFQDIGWQREALCRGRLSLFFTERNSSNRQQGLLPNERKAKALCARCPVRRECLEYGMDDDYGIWGGTSPPERRRMKKYGVDWILDAMEDQAVTYGLIEKEKTA